MNVALLAAGIVLASLAARERTGRRVRQTAAVLLAIVLIGAPFVTSTTAVLFDALAAACIAYGWNVIGGYTGYASFGNVAYLGLGAFVAAGFMSRQPGHPALPWFVGIPLAVAIVSVVAAAIGLAVLRLRGHYFSIATLGIGIAMPQVIQWDAAFGPSGVVPGFFGGGRPLNFPLAPDLEIGGLVLSADHYLFYYLALFTAAVGFGTTWWLSRSKFGYALVAIRENEEAAEVLGIDTTLMKSLAYTLSAALAALGGAAIGYRLTNMTTEADALFSTTNNLQMIVIALIGGVGSVWGPLIGAFVLFALQDAVRLVGSGSTFLQWQAIAFSLVIVLVVLFLPRGLMRFLRSRRDLTWSALRDELLAFRI